VVQDRGASTAVDGHAVALMAPRAGEPVGVQPRDQLHVTGALVHQVGDREIHGRLRCRSARLSLPEYHAPDGYSKLAAHHLAYMSHCFLMATGWRSDRTRT